MSNAAPVSPAPRFIRRAVDRVIDEAIEFGADLDPTCIAGDAVWALFGRVPWSPEAFSACMKRHAAEFAAAKAHAEREARCC